MRDVDPKTLSTPVRMMIALLDIEWQQATDGYAETPHNATWQRMLRIMHARFAWHIIPLHAKDEVAGSLMSNGAGLTQWIDSLEAMNQDRTKAQELREKIVKRHLPKTSAGGANPVQDNFIRLGGVVKKPRARTRG